MHTLLDLRGPIPSFIDVSNGKMGDALALEWLTSKAGASVRYRSEETDGPTAGTETVDPLEFLARVPRIAWRRENPRAPRPATGPHARPGQLP